MNLIFKNETKKQTQSTSEDVRYFDAKMFYHDLDNPEDYYLRVSSIEKNRFVRKDEVD